MYIKIPLNRSRQTFSSHNNFIAHVMISRNFSIILLIWWLLYLVAPLCAQNILITPNDQFNLLLKKEDLFQKHLPELKINSVEPIPMEMEPYDISLNYQVFNAIYNKSFYLLIENYDLFDEYLQGQELYPAKTIQPEIKKSHNTNVDRRLLNALTNKPKVDEEKMIREAWKKAFGIDVWYPYYKAKEIEDWVKERLSFKIFKLKGKPKFQKNQILYIFKTTF